MPIIDRAGTFRATVSDCILGENKNGKPQLVMQYSITEMLGANDERGNRQWIPFADYQFEARDYMILVDNNGEIMEWQWNRLRDVFEFSGNTFAALESHDFVNRRCQIVIEPNEYNGKISMKVRAVNPFNHEGGLGGRADKSAVSKWDAQFGSKLRSILPPPAAAGTVPSRGPATPPKPVPTGKLIGSLDRDNAVLAMEAQQRINAYAALVNMQTSAVWAACSSNEKITSADSFFAQEGKDDARHAKAMELLRATYNKAMELPTEAPAPAGQTEDDLPF